MSRACRKGSALTLVLAIGITSFLLAVLAHSSPNPARADTPEVITLVYPNFSDVSLLQLNGNAAKVGTALRVAPALGNQAGSAFFKTRVCLANQRSFSTYFSFLFTNPSTPPADGIVFAIQTVSNTAGSVGGGIGFRGISPSVGIEFDTYKNTGPLPDPIDPNDNHVGLDINGDVQSAVTANPPADMNGPTWHVWIDYSGLTDSLQVRMGLTNSRAAATLVMSQTVDLVAILDMDEVFVGYTAATGGKWENHDILGWYFDNDYDPIDVSTTTYSMAQTPAFTGAPTNTAQTVAEGAGLTAVAATDGDGSPITYSLETGALPAGITLQSDGSFLGTVDYSAFQNGPVYSSTIRAQDIYGLFADTSLVVTVTDTNRAPSITGGLTQVLAEGGHLTDLTASDPDGDPLTWTLTGALPDGITWDGDGTFSGMASDRSAGLYGPVVGVSDGKGGTDSQIMSIRVQNVVHEPVLAPVLGVNLSVNGRVFGEGSTIEFTLEYQNGPATVARGVLITASIPDHTGLIDCGAGTAAGSSVAWLLPEMGAGERGTLTYRVRVSTLPSAEEIASSTAAISCSTGDERGEARVEVLLFSNRYGPQVHRPYIIGYPDGEFKPYGPLTRAEIATAFMRILDLEDLAMGQSLYADVDPTFWAASAIEAVTRAELMEGYADGTFRPNQPITRAELAAIAARAAGAVGAPPITHHLGDLGDHWALDFIEGCFRSGIITGYGDSTFRPDSLILRDEAVTIINRLFYRGPLLGRAASFPDVDQEQWFFEQVEESAGGHHFMRNQDGSETEQP